MKREYIVLLEDTWYHFFIKPSRGLCVSKRTDVRYVFSDTLLPEAISDFSVVAAEQEIHIVCQDRKGSIYYIRFDGAKKTVHHLLESREKTSAFKNITLAKIGEFVNLFYVISSKEGFVLIHQILGETISSPKPVDYTKDTNFSLCNRKTSDLTLIYHSKEGVLGTKKFKWSKKEFEPFFPLEIGCDLTHEIVTCDNLDFLCIAGYASFDKFDNILFCKINEEKNDTNLSAVHLVSGTSEGLTFSSYDNFLCVSWLENGLVMTANLTKDNKWTNPKKYIRGNTQEIVLYHVETNSGHFASYGYKQDGKIVLYVTCDMLDSLPKRKSETNVLPHKKNDAENASYHAEYVRQSTYSRDLERIREFFTVRDNVTKELIKRINVLETKFKKETAIAEDMDAIDRLAAEGTNNIKN